MTQAEPQQPQAVQAEITDGMQIAIATLNSSGEEGQQAGGVLVKVLSNLIRDPHSATFCRLRWCGLPCLVPLCPALSLL